MVVVGEKTELLDLKEKIEKAMKAENNSDFNSFFHFIKSLGYGDGFYDSHSFRGHFTDAHISTTDDGKTTLYVYYESAWLPCVDAFDQILSERYTTLTEFTKAEEEGCEIFINTDATGKYFPERYLIYVENDSGDCEYAYGETLDESLKTLNADLDTSYKTVEEAEEQIVKNGGVFDIHEFRSL